MYGCPVMRCQTSGPPPAACTRTSTSLSPTTGSSMSRELEHVRRAVRLLRDRLHRVSSLSSRCRCTAYTTATLGVRRTLVKPSQACDGKARRGVRWMATKIDETARPREPLSRERVLRAAVALADEGGVESLSMRKLALELGVVPMALYKHVANKDEMLDGMVDVVVGEIDPPLARRRLEDRGPRADPLGPPGAPAPPVGLAGDRVAHRPDPDGDRVHGLDDRDLPGRRVLDRPDPPRDARDGQPHARLLAGAVRRHVRRRPADRGDRAVSGWPTRYPHITEMVTAISHDDASVVGPGCDDQFEFEFALDLMLDGLERLRTTA